MKINEVIVEGLATGLLKGLSFITGLFNPELEQKLQSAQVGIEQAAERNVPKLWLDDGQNITKKGNRWVNDIGQPVATTPEQTAALDTIYNTKMQSLYKGRGTDHPDLLTPVQRTIQNPKNYPQPPAQQTAAAAVPSTTMPAPAAAAKVRPLAQKLKQQKAPRYST